MAVVVEGKEWKTIHLGEIAEFRNGLNFTKSNFGSGLKVIGVRDFQDYSVPRYEALEEINPTGIAYDDSLLRNNDILFVRSNGNRDLIGRSLFITDLVGNVSHSGFTIRLRFMSKKVSPRFYAYHFRTPIIRRTLSAYGGGTNINNLNQKILAQLEVALPPFEIQQKIAAILSAYDNLIENNLRRIKILEETAQTLYREWFVKFRFPGHQKVKMVNSPLGKIPEGWKITPFSELLLSTLGGDWGSEKPSTKESHEVGVIRGTDFNVVKLGDISLLPNRYISEKSFGQRRLLAGDIVVENSINAKSRSSGNSILITNGFMQRLGKNIIGASFCRVFRLKDLQLSPLIQVHMKYLFKEGKMAFYQNVAANGIANFQTERFLSKEKIALPTQPKMRKYLIDMFGLFNNSMLADKNYYLRQTRDLLLPKLISGELDVSELDITIPEAKA
jgi:type I restriction enzyme, S subunit